MADATESRIWSIKRHRFQWPWVTLNLDFKVTGLLLIDAFDVLCAQLTRDLLAIAKFSFFMQPQPLSWFRAAAAADEVDVDDDDGGGGDTTSTRMK